MNTSTDKNNRLDLDLFINKIKNEKIPIYEIIINNKDFFINFRKSNDKKLINFVTKIDKKSDKFDVLGYCLVELNKILQKLKYELISSDDVMVLNKKVNYTILIVDPEIENLRKCFHALIILYYASSSVYKNYVGIDFEFHTSRQKLTQLCFEYQRFDESVIVITDTLELLEDYTEIFNDLCNLIFLDNKIMKIGHGSDSQDIPFILEVICSNKYENKIKFLKSFIDTQYLSQYYQIANNFQTYLKKHNVNKITKELAEKYEKNEDLKSSIYDKNKKSSMIYQFKLINESQQEDLTNMYKHMDTKRDWNIKNMKDPLLWKYAWSDVMYLKYFYFQIISLAGKKPIELSYQHREDDIETKSLEKSISKGIKWFYSKLLVQLIQWCFIFKKNIVDFQSKYKNEVDPMNNYIIKEFKDSKGRMINLYQLFFKNVFGIKIYVLKDDFKAIINFDIFYPVTHFKSYVWLVMRRIFYNSLAQKYKIYKKKDIIWDGKLLIKEVINDFDSLDFDILSDVFTKVYEYYENV